jgi:SHS family lactate transporter-like MFS transporter
MISILWYSACNFIAGFSPTFLFLLVFRTLLGIGMGAEWPAGSIFGLFATYMTRELHLTASQVGWPLAFSNGLTFIASFVWGSLTDSIGRRWAMIIPAVIGAAIAPIYLLTTDYTMIVVAFSIQGAFAGAIYGINPSYANERFPTEIRATAAAFCYHMGAVVGGFVPPLLTYFAIERQMGFAVPMLIGTVGGLISFVVTLFFSPETKGQIMEADLKIVSAAQAH